MLIGGPRVDAGHTVKLIDHDAYGWDYPRLIDEIRRCDAECVMLGHTGSTAARPVCLATGYQLYQNDERDEEGEQNGYAALL